MTLHINLRIQKRYLSLDNNFRLKGWKILRFYPCFVIRALGFRKKIVISVCLAPIWLRNLITRIF